MGAIRTRPEAPEDYDAIADVTRAAFRGEDEVKLLPRLRETGALAFALVAEEGGEIVGHIAFSHLEVTLDGRRVPALALAPVSVTPRLHRGGIGGLLIEAGHAEGRTRGFEAVFVLGHPSYYPRFGFDAALAARFAAPFRGAAFMALALKPGALDGVAGTVAYPAAFGI